MKHIHVPLLLLLILATAVLPSSSTKIRSAPEVNLLRFSVVGPDMTAIAELLAVDSPRTLVARVEQREAALFSRPTSRSRAIATLTNPTETGGPLVLPVLDSSLDGWLQVRLPIRPNGTTGWISASSVKLTTNFYRVDIDTSEHLLKVFYKGRLLREAEVAIGTGPTPTPIGSFYLTELLQPNDPDGIYGPFAFGLSGYSETLLSFNGGDGVIGLHGTNDPDALGSDVSHGCVRIHNDTITELASFLPLGTPVNIEK